MSQIAKFLGTPIWQSVGAILTLVSIFVAFYLATQNIIWLLAILWIGLLLTAMILCITLRERVKNHQPTDLYFYSMCFALCLICCLLGLSLIAVVDLKAKPEAASTSTPTSIPTSIPTSTPNVRLPIPTPTSKAPQGDLLETWAFRTRMWEDPALVYPYAELTTESQPGTHLSYVFTYRLLGVVPSDPGFSFELYQIPDLSAYESVQIKFRFSGAGTNCYVGLTDDEGHSFGKSLGNVGTDYWTTVTFPLDSTFPGVNRHAITQVFVSTDSSTYSSDDVSVHKCIINEIRFFRP